MVEEWGTVDQPRIIKAAVIPLLGGYGQSQAADSLSGQLNAQLAIAEFS